jgi:hypothetical protein
MAWLFLQENEQVQYLQKIALRAENLSSLSYLISTNKYFLRKQFSAAIEAAHFPAPQIDALQQSREGAPFMGTALAEYGQCIEAHVSNPFSPSCLSFYIEATNI